MMADEANTNQTGTNDGVAAGQDNGGAGGTAVDAGSDTGAAGNGGTGGGGTDAGAEGRASGIDPKAGAQGADDKIVAAAKFPEDWREQMAMKDGKPDEKMLKTLQRYQSPTAAAEALLELRAKLSEGGLKKPLGENPTAEEIKQFRTDNGIPEKIEDYAKVALPEGLAIGEQDKPLISNFMQKMLDKNISPASAKAAVAAYYENVDMIMAQTEEADTQYVTNNEDALRTEWGADYRKNMNAINNLVATFNPETAAMLIHARGPDGRLLGDNALFRKELARIALDLNPAASVVSSTSGDPGKGLDEQIASLKKEMDTDIKAWHKNLDGQKKYTELLEIKAKMDAQGK